MTDKEKKLLDFIFEQGKQLVKFMNDNGYGDEYRGNGFTAYADGDVYASFANIKNGKVTRICEKKTAFGQEAEYEEKRYDED